MTILREEREVISSALITASGQTIRSPDLSCEWADYAVLLIKATELGSPGAGDNFVAYAMHKDANDNEFVDANTTYGTITLTGSDTPINKAVVVPYLGKTINVKLVGGGTISSTTGFYVTVTLILVGNTDIPDLYK